MSFAERLAAGAFPVALEITPPQRENPAVLLRRAGLLGPCASAINVISRPDRQRSLDASIALRQHGYAPAWHLVTRGRDAADISARLARARMAGIGQVLVVRGDHEAPDVGDGITIRDAIALARRVLPGALVGATLNQYAPARDAVLRNLIPKLRAGADYVQTQPVFDAVALEPLVASIRADAPATKVVAMAMPLLSADAHARIEERLGIALPVPPPADEAEAWESFSRLLAELRSSPFVDGVAIMSFEMDPQPPIGARIVEALVAAGIVPRQE